MLNRLIERIKAYWNDPKNRTNSVGPGGDALKARMDKIFKEYFSGSPIEEVKARFGTLSLKPHDTIVLTYEGALSPDAVEKIETMMKRALGNSIKVLVMDDGLRIDSVMSMETKEATTSDGDKYHCIACESYYTCYKLKERRGKETPRDKNDPRPRKHDKICGDFKLHVIDHKHMTPPKNSGVAYSKDHFCCISCKTFPTCEGAIDKNPICDDFILFVPPTETPNESAQ